MLSLEHMILVCYLIILSIILFSAYIIYSLCQWGIPNNISATYYYFERTRKHYGLFFPIDLLVCCAIVIPIWIYTCQIVSPWASHFSMCPYLTCLCMIIVGITSRYKRSRKLTYIHYTAAIIGATITGIWLLIACYKISFIGLSVVLISVMAGCFTRTLKKCYLFWLEIAAFYALFFVLFIINFFPVCV